MNTDFYPDSNGGFSGVQAARFFFCLLSCSVPLALSVHAGESRSRSSSRLYADPAAVQVVQVVQAVHTAAPPW